MPLPEKIKNKPNLFMGSELFYQAFLDLTTCRQISANGEGPISWLNIDYYCNRFQLSGETSEDMHYLIAKMDEAYLKLRNPK